jgi:proline iminopeptidase
MIRRFLIIPVFCFLFANMMPISQATETLLDHTPRLSDEKEIEIPSVPMLCEQFHGEKRYVNIGDCKLYCEIEGDGIALVVIHGGPGGTHHCFHPWLSNVAESFKVITYDQRGCGLSDHNPGEGYCFQQTIEDLEALRRALEIDQWIVVGHSYGGAIAQFYGITYPERVLGQILIGSVPMATQEVFEETRQNDYLSEQELARKGEITNAYRAGDLALEQYFYLKDLNGDWKRQNFIKPSPTRLAQMARYDIVFDQQLTTDYGMYDFENLFLTCPLPTLIIEGKYDLIWSAEKAMAMHKLHPNADLVIFEKSGHNVYSDQPDEFVTLLKDWSQKLSLPSDAQIKQWQTHTTTRLADQLGFIDSNKRIAKMIQTDGAAAAMAYYQEAKTEDPKRELFAEASINIAAYQLMFAGKPEEALIAFKMNVLEFPESGNVYDSFAECYLAIGDTTAAKENYKKSLELDPENANARSVLLTLSD